MAICSTQLWDVISSFAKSNRDVGKTVDASEVLGYGYNQDFNVIDWTEFVKTAKWGITQQSWCGAGAADGSHGSSGSASGRGEAVLALYLQLLLSLASAAEQIQEQSQWDRMVYKNKEKDIKLMNSWRDPAASGANVRKALDSGPVGTVSCLMPLQSHGSWMLW